MIHTANRIQRESNECIFDGAVAKAGFESVILPDLKIRYCFWRVVESEHEAGVLEPDARGAIPSVFVNASVFIQRERRLSKVRTLIEVNHDLGCRFLPLILCGFEGRYPIRGRNSEIGIEQMEKNRIE